MSGHAPDTAPDDVAGRARAAQWSLEYVEPYAISVDPRALSLLLRSECKRLRAVPLSATGRGAVVAVADPSDERFEALRALAGEQTRFVVISERTLDALLSSRMFAEAPAVHDQPAHEPAAPAPASAAAPAPAAAEYHAPEPQAHDAGPALGPAAAATQAVTAPAEPPPAPVYAPAPAPAVVSGPVEVRLDAELVDAIVSALEQRLPPPATAPVAPALPFPAPAELAPPEGFVNGSASELLAHVDGTIATWNSLRGSLAGVADELEETKKLLREAKEALSVSHAENDQHQKRVRALESEVAESRALVAETRARLQDAADALDSGVARIETPAEY